MTAGRSQTDSGALPGCGNAGNMQRMLNSQNDDLLEI